MPAPFQDGGYPPRKASDVRFYIDGENAFAAISAAIESASRYVYVTCAYARANFMLRPPHDEELLDLLSRAAERGVQVAVLFWQPDRPTPGTTDRSEYPTLKAAAPKVAFGWDRAQSDNAVVKVGCHHQKTFVIDGETAFVGGINMDQEYWDTQAHLPIDDRRVSYGETDRTKAHAVAAGPDSIPLHDVFSSFGGAAVEDVHANFVERWEGAFMSDHLEFMECAATDSQGSPIQVLRTVAANSYPTLPNGEKLIKKAALDLIAGATSSIYFENQYLYEPEVADALRAAAKRRVQIVGLITRRPDKGTVEEVVEDLMSGRCTDELQPTHDSSITDYVRLYTPITEGTPPTKDIYVHSKTMVVDDRYILHGSANFSTYSLELHTEMDILVDDAALAKALRLDLWAEHLCLPRAEVPEDFARGFEAWKDYGVRNLQALQAHDRLVNRVVPFRGQSLENV